MVEKVKESWHYILFSAKSIEPEKILGANWQKYPNFSKNQPERWFPAWAAEKVGWHILELKYNKTQENLKI